MADTQWEAPGTLQRAPAPQDTLAPDRISMFEGEGIQVASARWHGAQDADDEFDYAFTGAQRQGMVHKRVFKAAPVPSHLVSDMTQQPLGAVGEQEEEEEEEEEEGPHVVGVGPDIKPPAQSLSDSVPVKPPSSASSNRTGHGALLPPSDVSNSFASVQNSQDLPRAQPSDTAACAASEQLYSCSSAGTMETADPTSGRDKSLGTPGRSPSHAEDITPLTSAGPSAASTTSTTSQQHTTSQATGPMVSPTVGPSDSQPITTRTLEGIQDVAHSQRSASAGQAIISSPPGLPSNDAHPLTADTLTPESTVLQQACSSSYTPLTAAPPQQRGSLLQAVPAQQQGSMLQELVAAVDPLKVRVSVSQGSAQLTHHMQAGSGGDEDDSEGVMAPWDALLGSAQDESSAAALDAPTTTGGVTLGSGPPAMLLLSQQGVTTSNATGHTLQLPSPSLYSVQQPRRAPEEFVMHDLAPPACDSQKAVPNQLEHLMKMMQGVTLPSEHILAQSNPASSASIVPDLPSVHLLRAITKEGPPTDQGSHDLGSYPFGSTTDHSKTVLSSFSCTSSTHATSPPPTHSWPANTVTTRGRTASTSAASTQQALDGAIDSGMLQQLKLAAEAGAAALQHIMGSQARSQHTAGSMSTTSPSLDTSTNPSPHITYMNDPQPKHVYAVIDGRITSGASLASQMSALLPKIEAGEPAGSEPDTPVVSLGQEEEAIDVTEGLLDSPNAACVELDLVDGFFPLPVSGTFESATSTAVDGARSSGTPSRSGLPQTGTSGGEIGGVPSMPSGASGKSFKAPLPPPPGALLATSQSRNSARAGPGSAAGGAGGVDVAEEDEWAAANARVEARAQAQKQQASSSSTWRPAQYGALLERVQGTRVPASIQAQALQVLKEQGKKPGFFASLFCMVPPDLPMSLINEQAEVLCWAKTRYEEESRLHWDLLTSSFCLFTGRRTRPGRVGAHWAELGWQGDDPATDLRGAGVLGLIQLMSLWTIQPDNAQALFRLSRSATQEFPLAIVSLNCTNYTTQALREGKLNKAITQSGSVWDTVASFHAGAMYTFYNVWWQGKKTMAQAGFVMKELEQRCLSSPDATIRAASATLMY